MEIIPAILPKDFGEIEEKTGLIKGLSDIIQIDICDGNFVPSLSWPYKKIDVNFDKIIKEEMGMPEWDSIDYEFDLMIRNPNKHDMNKWIIAGAKRIVLHIESSDDLSEVINVLNGLVDIGLAINVSTPVDKIEKYREKISYIQVMGIRKIGFQGQSFDDSVINKIKEIKTKYPDMLLQIDGGVNLHTAVDLEKTGVDRLVVGSALFESDNIVDTYHKFERI